MSDRPQQHDPSLFDEILSAPPLLPPRFHSFAQMLFEGAEDPDPTILLGSVDRHMVQVSLGRLRRITLTLIHRLHYLGVERGQTVCLLRLPRTSETMIAAAFVALSVWGVRVLLPMFVEPERIGGWLAASRSRVLLWNEKEARERYEVESDRDMLDALAGQAVKAGVATLCLEGDLGLPSLLEGDFGDPIDEAIVGELLQSSGPEDPCLLLTTSGTSGRSKMVQYTAGAFLRSCAAFEQAGLLEPGRIGGRGLCLLFAHSMGIRALWNALWQRSALCLIPPEWFVEHPARARSFLTRMRPDHVTGGPAVYRTLLELARLFPTLKDECLGSIRCAVASGAPFDPSLAARLQAAVDLPLHNALGLTETQQVTSTVVSGPLDRKGPCLGNLLPGVSLGLRAAPNYAPNAHRLFVASPFGAQGYVEQDGHVHPLPGPPGWFDSGDIVERYGDGLRYVSRGFDDFFKDGFGVKIHRRRVLELYDGMQEPILHLEPFALRDDPGLGALVFVAQAQGTRPHGVSEAGTVPSDPTVVRRVRDLLMARLEVLRGDLEEMEFRHMTVSRFVCIAGPPPTTAKGEVSRADLMDRFDSIVQSLRGRFIQGPGRDYVRKDAWIRSRNARLTSPRRGELLRIARLDKDFVAARGDTLTYEQDGERVDVIDFVGSFGGNLIGHRHPAIVDAMRTFLDGSRPAIGDQGSAQNPAGRLAKALCLAVGRSTGAAYVVRFGSTGAEAVEMAIAHAQIERIEHLRKHHRTLLQTFGSIDPGRVRRCVEEGARILEERIPKLLILSSSFHGHSLGARSALGPEKSRRPYTTLSRIEPIRLDLNSTEGSLLDLVLRERFHIPSLTLREGQVCESSFACSSIVAALAEPVLGEGGVRTTPQALLRALASHEFPLILDEIQCGLGRTGSLLASEGVRGHYYLFAKALGGGFTKVSAVLIERHRYVEKFDEHYASTFAADALSSTIGCAVLDVIGKDDIPARARERGAVLRAALERVCGEFPDVFGPVRGRGLMLGVEILPSCVEPSMLLRGALTHEHLGVLVCSALFHRHRVRILPTLSAPHTLRIEPSAYIEDDSIHRLESALRWLGVQLRDLDMANLVEHLVREEDDRPTDSPVPDRGHPICTKVHSPTTKAVRVGFVNHFVVPERELALVDPSLARWSCTQRIALFHRFMELFELDPLIAFARNILGDQVWFLSVANAVDAATFESLHRSQDRVRAIERVQRSVDLAASKGCKVIALGAYSSIITSNGNAICPPPDTVLTSGNTLTVAVAARRILHACEACGIDPRDPATCVGIVGATGNIGAALAHRLLAGPKAFGRALLVSRTPHHLERLRASLSACTAQQAFTSDLSRIRECNVIALSVNTNEPLLFPHHLGDHVTVVGDVSLPGAVSPAVRSAPGVRFVHLAGVVTLPGEPDFVMSSHSPPGTAFCCAAEAMLLGLEAASTRDLQLLGDVDPHAVDVLDRLAAEHAWLDTLDQGTNGS